MATVKIKVDSEKLNAAAEKLKGALANLPIIPGLLIGGEAIYGSVLVQAREWENRQARWRWKYPNDPADYAETLELYRQGIKSALALGYSPDRAMPIHTDSGFVWLTLKEVLEGITQRKLCDIKPDDAIELARETPFSAEQWYIGCTGS